MDKNQQEMGKVREADQGWGVCLDPLLMLRHKKKGSVVTPHHMEGKKKAEVMDGRRENMTVRVITCPIRELMFFSFFIVIGYRERLVCKDEVFQAPSLPPPPPPLPPPPSTPSPSTPSLTPPTTSSPGSPLVTLHRPISLIDDIDNFHCA